MRRIATRLARMDRAELQWRFRTASRTTTSRISSTIRPPRWVRKHLVDRLSDTPGLEPVKTALRGGDVAAAHDALSRHFCQRRSRFVVHPTQRNTIAEMIVRSLPSAPDDAAQRGNRILEGRYDLLGYQGLTFTSDTSAEAPQAPDWHVDPVHHRRAPSGFWSTVPYLDPGCGDHKVIWELNRHQHWLALGRAWWLTGHTPYRARFIAELASWLDANPPLTGINWTSMLELALRSISWLWALHLFVDPGDSDETPWTVDLLLGLDRQLTHVEQNLSYYFSPNTHLLGEALALYAAGRALPELASSDRWSAIGRRILVAETARQITADGGHCERSTHYHRYTLDFYMLALAVARVTDDPIAAAFERSVSRLATAARLLADATGRAPHLGDDDGGMLLPIAGRAADDWRDSLAIASALTGDESLRIDGAPVEEAMWMLQAHAATGGPVRIRSAALPATGYYISRGGPRLHVVIDGGPHGYQNAGHAHADALALTASCSGQPLLIDTGTACYTIDPAVRDRFRATQAHNTVVFGGRSQSIPATPFQWATVADGTTHRWRVSDGFDYFDGSHDGYAPIIHRRRVFVLHDELMVVVDHVADSSGRAQPVDAAVHWHVDPRWSVDIRHRVAMLRAGADGVNLVVPAGLIERFDGDTEAGLGWHSPVYGRLEPATTLRLGVFGPAPCWTASVFDFRLEDPVHGVEWQPLWAEAGTLAHGTALRIDRDASSVLLLLAEPVAADTGATWRVGEFETDARLLFASTTRGALTRLALVDGSMVRGVGRRSISLSLGRMVPALFVDESSIGTFTPCAVSPAS
jgi:uncharacterized heparinase superfamily protein